MSAMTAPMHFRPTLLEIRALCGALAAVVLFDTAMVRAPGLGLLAVPFLVGALWMRRGSTAAMVGMLLLSALYVVVGVNYAVANGFDAGVGDLAFAYVGTPVAVALVALSGMRLLSHERS